MAKIVNGKINYKELTLFNAFISKNEGKDLIVSIEPKKNAISEDLYAFYFGIIIRKECMQSEAFSTYYDEYEIHQIFQEKLRSYIVMENTGTEDAPLLVPKRIVDNVLIYSNEDFKLYVSDLITYLAHEFDIHVKEKSEYIIPNYRKTRNGKTKKD